MPHFHGVDARRILTTTGFVAALALVPNRDAVADPMALLGGDASIEAERLDVDVAGGTATLTGNVVLAKGNLKVSCPRIDLKFDASPHLTWARGSGGVAADVKGVHAEAPEVELDLPKQLLELRGGVKLTRGQGFLQAERATIEIATAKVTLTQVKGSIPVPPKGP
ncbi:MAG: LptA/OstA family protein [Polyangiaceae bacterium]